MRWLLALVVACSSPAKRAEPPSNASPDASVSTPDAAFPRRAVGEPFTLEVMTLDVIGKPDPDVTRRAKDLTVALRAAAREYSGLTVVSSGKHLLDLKIMFACDHEAPKCMAAITKSLPADRMLWGSLEGDRAKLHLINAANEVVVHWLNEGAPLDDVGLERIARDAIQALVSRAP